MALAFALLASWSSAQTIRGTDRVTRSRIQVFDLRIDASPQEMLEAKAAYQQGHIVRVIGGSPADLRRLIEAGAFDVNEPSSAKKAAQSARPQPVPYVSAVRLGAYGEVHQFSGSVSAGAKESAVKAVQDSFEAWRLKETNTVGDPAPPSQAWTQVLSLTGSENGDWGSAQTVFQVFRLNGTDTSGDYYMVLTDPMTSPNFEVAPTNCASLFLAPCGWYTSSRTITMATTPSAVVFDHGPTTKITTGSGSWTIGIGIPGAASASYSQNWSQDSVTTTDQTNVTTGTAQWSEAFVSETACCNPLPATSTSAFLSHQGAIFKVAPGSSFQLNVSVDPTIIYQPSFGNPSQGGGGFYFNGTISPPQFSADPATITIAPGTTGTVQVVAKIGDDTLGLPWEVTNIPLWLNVDKTSGARTTLLHLTVTAGTPLGTLGTLNFNTNPPFAAPSVVSGPLTMNIKVGQPDLHGALIIGGSLRAADSENPLGTALLYSADANQFVGVSGMTQARAFHTSTLLKDGTILVAGGMSGQADGTALATAELYDPTVGGFSSLSPNANCPGAPGCMVSAGSSRVATMLGDGRVLITGGIDVNEDCMASAEVYDPVKRTFTAAGDMTSPRCYQTATLLPNGEVLIFGGLSDLSVTTVATTAELYNPTTNTFRLTASNPVTPSYGGTATLTGGTVLLAGGADFNNVLASAQVYFPSSGTFQAIVNLSSARIGHTATLLQDGRVLIAGGEQPGSGSTGNLATAEIYDPATQTFTLLSGSATCPGASGCLTVPRAYHTDTIFLDGRVFLSGGLSSDLDSALTTTDIFDPVTNTFSAGPTFDGRVSHTSAFLHASSVTAVTSSANPSPVGQPVTLTATVTVSNPKMLSGNITFYDGTTALGSSPLNNGSAALTVNLKSGQHPITAAFSGNESYGPSTSAVLVQQVDVTPTTMSLSSSANPSQYGSNVTFTAQLTASGSTVPSGTVQFLDGGAVIGTVPVTQRTIQLTLNNLSAGSHSITAAYSGDTNYGSDTSNQITQTVNGVASQTALTTSINPAAFGATVVFAATVSSAQGSGPTPTGRVVFADAGTPISSVNLSNGAALFTTSTLTPGAHQITASYSGDGVYAASVSTALTENINGPATTTTLVPVKNPVVYGEDVIAVTVTVTAPGTNKPTGSVSLVEGTSTLASGLLDSNGQANLTYPQGLNSGAHVLTASYAGSSGFGASVSQPIALTVDQAQSATSLAVTPADPTNYGQLVNLTATVSGPGSKQTGSVTFLDGTRTIGTSTLNAGTAVFSTATLSGGSHALSANYSGDINYTGSQASAVTRNVAPVVPTVTLTSSINPASIGQNVNLNITVSSAAGTPTGKVAIMNGSSPIALVDLSSGSASYTLQDYKPGTYNLFANYQGDGNFASASSTALSQVISYLTATIRLSSSQNPSQYKSNVVLAATVTGAPSFTPSGTLTFYDGTAVIGTAQINNGQGTFSTNSLSVGTHAITVSWPGDDYYQAVTSSPVSQVVNPATTATTTALTSSKNPSNVGDSVMFQAQVQSSTTGGTTTPTGTVTFMDGTTPLGSSPLAAGVASFTTSALTMGAHSITAVYGGDTNFNSSTSPAVAQTVNATPTVTVTLTSQTNPSQVGLPAIFNAAVSSAGGTPTGTVTFLDGTTTLGTVALSNGAAVFNASSLSAGTHNITAVYSGDGTYPRTTSNGIAQQVNKASSSVALSADINPSNLNQPVTFTASVTSHASTLTGSVTFQDGTASLGTVPLNAGVAVLTTSALSGGSHNITAVYSGSGDVQGSTSHVLTHVVNAMFPATAVITATPNPSAAGQTVNFTVTVTSTGGGVPTGSVTLSEGAVIYGSAFLTNGVAVIPVNTLTAGGHSIAATYGGDSTHSATTSSTYQQQVN